MKQKERRSTSCAAKVPELFGAMLIVILVWAFPAAAQKPSSPQFDLKGDTVGETIEAFKKAHPSAHCFKNDPARVVQNGEDTCEVHRGISFAGLPAMVDEDCDQAEAANFKVGDGHNCYQGLIAQFRGGKLIFISYTVEAEGGLDIALKQVLTALYEKYGEPTKNGTWSNGREVLYLRNWKTPDERRNGTIRYTDTILIELYAIEDISKKDI